MNPMDFKMTAPCDNCPFRKEGGIRLRPDRAREIAHQFTDSQGGTFPCHKTVDYGTEDDEGNTSLDGTQMCAGGLLFAEKQGKANQLVRIMERIGAYDARKLAGHDLVFDSLAMMLKAQLPKGRECNSASDRNPKGGAVRATSTSRSNGRKRSSPPSADSKKTGRPLRNSRRRGQRLRGGRRSSRRHRMASTRVALRRDRRFIPLLKGA
jgi:hypothetical protein